MNDSVPVRDDALRSAPAGLGLVPAALAALAAYAVVAVIHLVAQVIGSDAVATVTQSLAVPCLLVLLVAQISSSPALRARVP